MVVSAGEKADLQRVGMLSSLREISMYFETSATIVKFTQLCSTFPPTALLNFACDWLAFDRDISFGWLTSPNV